MSMKLFMTVNADIFKIGIVFLILGAILMGFVSGLKRLFTKNKKRFFLYVLVILVVFGATALLSNDKVLNDVPLNNFISFQVIFLILGVLHVLALRKFFPDISENRTFFWTEFLYTIVVCGIGLISFMFVNDIYKPAYTYIFTVAAIYFVIPFLIVKLYEFAVSVPVPIYKKWFYPIHQKVKDPKAEEFENPHVIFFEFNKGESQDEFSRFSLKAPERMEFGRLFYIFINDYNERHPEGMISYLDAHNNPNGWIFHTKPNWFKGQRHIDFARTVIGNNIKEKDVIVCRRA
ncbi:TssN family type VI secretion system protein [Ascidiimonas sp. W6]|uniref:TssN family type VI secretion system protein n=1 Tax=Ascidiimonas meishanensis TaxID=3128903 RepID=UPI0030EB5004